MATQGVVGVVKDGATRLEVVAGSDGYNASVLAAWLRKHPGAPAQEVYDQALTVGFGSKENLVVQHSPRGFVSGEQIRSLSGLYRDSFADPKFNPRWELGTADHVEIVME